MNLHKKFNKAEDLSKFCDDGYTEASLNFNENGKVVAIEGVYSEWYAK